MRSEVLGTYDVLLVGYGTKWKNEKIVQVLSDILSLGLLLYAFQTTKIWSIHDACTY